MLRMKAGYRLWANIYIPFCFVGSSLFAVCQLLFWSQFSCRCRVFGASGRQSHSSTSLVQVFLQPVLGSVPPQPHALPLQRLPSVQAGAGLPTAWCDSFTHWVLQALRGTRMWLSLASQGSKRLSVEMAAVWKALHQSTWSCPSMVESGGWRGGHERHLSPSLL